MSSLRSKFVWTGLLVLCAVLPVLARHVGQRGQRGQRGQKAHRDAGDGRPIGQPDASGRVNR